MKIINDANIRNINTNLAVPEKSDNEFGQKLDEKRDSANVKQRLKNLLERIDIQATRLSSSMTLSELKEYKRLVSEFLNVAVNTSHKFSKESYLDSRGRRRVFSIVKTVNQEIESLTQEVMKKEKSRIDILGKLDDVRGMLLDLVA